MSKLDEAYDQVDIDNGGGGICTLFTQLIAEKLYQANMPREADDIICRTLWWAERVPYMGDSFAANAVEYRQDTPYQCAIGAVSGAQAIIFGLCGVSVDFDGRITVKPCATELAGENALTGIRLRGRVFDLAMDGEGFSVAYNGATLKGRYGEAVTLP